MFMLYKSIFWLKTIDINSTQIFRDFRIYKSNIKMWMKSDRFAYIIIVKRKKDFIFAFSIGMFKIFIEYRFASLY